MKTEFPVNVEALRVILRDLKVNQFEWLKEWWDDELSITFRSTNAQIESLISPPEGRNKVNAILVNINGVNTVLSFKHIQDLWVTCRSLQIGFYLNKTKKDFPVRLYLVTWQDPLVAEAIEKRKGMRDRMQSLLDNIFRRKSRNSREFENRLKDLQLAK